MTNQLTNSKGEKLFILTVVYTNNIKPAIMVATWKKCLDDFNTILVNENSERFFSQVIHKEVHENTADASMRCNRKGWGSDFFKYLTIEPLLENKFNK